MLPDTRTGRSRSRRRHGAGAGTSTQTDPEFVPRHAAPDEGPDAARRRTNWPAVGLVTVVVVAAVAVGAAVVLDRPDIAQYADDELRPLVTESQQVGDQVRTLAADPSGLARPEIERRYAPWVDESADLLRRARDADPPDELSETTSYLLGCLRARADGIVAQRDAILAAIDAGGDQTTLVQTLLSVNRDLVGSDRQCAYASDVSGPVLERVGGRRLPVSAWFPDPVSTELPATQIFVSKLFGSPHVAGLREVSITSIETDPAPSNVGDDGMLKLLASDDGTLGVTIKVRNVGERVEDTVAVKVTLRPHGEETTQRKIAEVTNLEPGAEKTVTVTGLIPGEGRNRLSVSAGPVPGERDTADNLKTIELEWFA